MNTPKKSIRIGDRTLEAFVCDDSIDKFDYSVEVSSSASEKYMQIYFPRYLKGINGKSFPNNVNLSIYDYRTGFRQIDMLWVQKQDDDCSLIVSISFDFSFWDLPESLGIFVDRYIGNIKETGTIQKVSMSHEEYGYNIHCTSVSEGSDDLYQKLREMEHFLESVYRQQILPSNSTFTKKYGEEPRHWWIRYVIVPLVGSGTIAAVLVKYLLK